MHVSKLTPVLISTVIITGISVFPFLNFLNFLCCAGVMLGSFLGTAYYYKQLKNINETIQFKDGAAIGLLSGILSALITLFILTLMTIAFKQNPVPMLYELIDKQGINIPPEAENLLRKISDEYNRSGFSITITIINLIAYLITYPLFGILGGIIGVSIFRKREMKNS